MSYLAVEDLCVEISGYKLLSGMNFRLYSGEMCALIGPSGAGKSTLIKAMLGLQPYQRGRIRLPNQHTPIAYVPQDDHLHTALRVEQALDYACQLRLATLNKVQRRHHIHTICREVGLAERLNHPIAKLSGGQRKRVSVALEMLTKPDFMILDEPTSGLDPGMDTQLMQLFSLIAQQQKIVLVATHSMQNLMLCHHLLVMKQGYLVFFGSPAVALTWFKVTQLENIFLQLQSQTAEAWHHQYKHSAFARTYAKRLPPKIQAAREGKGKDAVQPMPQDGSNSGLSQAEQVLRDIRLRKP